MRLRSLAISGPVFGILLSLGMIAVRDVHIDGDLRRGVIAASVVTGALLGLIAEGVAKARSRGLAACAHVVALVVVLHVALVAWAMARSPRLYSVDWYERGGVRRTIQLATEVLGPFGVVIVTLIGLTAYVGHTRAADVFRKRGLARALAVPLFAASVGSGDTGPSRPTELAIQRPNVLLVVVDSLPADRLATEVLPHVSAYADHEASFDHAYVSIPSASPSIATLLTGRWPRAHGIRSNVLRRTDRGRNLDAVPEHFARAGYETRVLADRGGEVFSDVGFGFARVAAPSASVEADRRANELERVLPAVPILQSSLARWLEPQADVTNPMSIAAEVEGALDAPRDRPFFTTAFFSADRPALVAPSPVSAKFTNGQYRGRYRYRTPTGSTPVDAEDRAQIRALSDGAASATDEAIGHLLGYLKARRLDESTIVIVVGSRGSAAGESALGGLSDDAVRVPLVVHVPKSLQRAHRIPDVVRDVDLAPTLYELASIEPPPNLDGVSLVPILAGGALEPRYAYAEADLLDESLELESGIPLPPRSALVETVDDRISIREDSVAPILFAKPRAIRDARFTLLSLPTRRGDVTRLVEGRGSPRDVSLEHPTEVAHLRSALSQWTEPPARTLPNVLWLAIDGLGPRSRARLRERGIHIAEIHPASTIESRFLSTLLSGALPSDIDRASSRFEPTEAYLPHLLRHRGVTTQAFVENVETDASLGFENTVRRIGRRACKVTDDAANWLRDHRETRFFVFVGCRSATPSHEVDENVERMLSTLDEIDGYTILVATEERVSSRGQGEAFIVARGHAGVRIDSAVSTIDLAATVIDLANLEVPRTMRGRSLLSPRGPPNIVVTESPTIRSAIIGRYRLVTDLKAPARRALFDLSNDPSSAHDLALREPEIAADLDARLTAMLERADVAGSEAGADRGGHGAVIHLRFAGGERPRRVSGTLALDDLVPIEAFDVVPVGLGRDALELDGDRVEVAFVTSPEAVVGFDVTIDPSASPLRWSFALDDHPLPAEMIFGGAEGIVAPKLLGGVVGDEDRIRADGRSPFIDPKRDRGLFVSRERR